MAASMYTSLDQATREIRLAHLAPSRDLETQPSCSLHIVSLDDNPIYEALSYVWGDPTITAPIQLQESPRRSFDEAEHIPALSGLSVNETHSTQWPITTNLEAALRYLRHKSEVRILWIDAICIDQANIEERNHQVPLMKSIYSNAETVRIWLGPPVPRSDDAMAILKQIGQGIRVEKIKLQGQLITDNDLECVIELLERPWWTRTWVRQELILAKRAYFHCGFNSLEWVELPKIRHMNNLFQERRTALRSGRFTLETLNRFLLCSEWLEQLESLEMVYLRQKYEAREHILPVLLGFGRLCSNSDSRDSIYGFLGLMSENVASQIKPDYNIPVSEVFKDTAVQLMTCTNSLIFLSLTRYTPKDHRLLPTWVPSWHALNEPDVLEWKFIIDRLFFHRSFNACGSQAAKFKNQQGNVLNLTGVQFDRILGSGIGGVMAALLPPSQILNIHNEWKRLSCSHVPEQSSYVAGGQAFEAFLRVLLGDLFPKNVKKLDDEWRQCQSKDDKIYRKAYSEWLRVTKENTEPATWTSDLAKAYQWGFQRICTSRRFFVTKRGYFGIGPAQLAEGDQVYIVAGGRVPLILRPLSQAPPNTFELVGDCFVQGVMHGEAVTEPPQTPESSSWKKAVAAAKSIVRPSSKSLDPDLPLRDFHDIFIV